MQLITARSSRIIQFMALLLTLMLFTGVMAANASASVPVLSLPQVQGQPGAIVQVPVNLVSEGQIVGMQFDLSFDGQLLQYQSEAKGSLTQDYNLATNQLNPGKVRVLVTHSANAAIASESGSVVILSFKVSETAQPGQSCPLSLTGVVLSESAGRAIQPFEQSNGAFRVVGTLTLNVPPVGPITVGQTAQINATTDPGDPTFTYVSDNPGVATVSDTGLITGVCNGTAAFTVSASKPGYIPASTTVSITVNKGVMGMDVNQPAAPLALGETFQLQPLTEPVGATFNYLSDNPSAATVSETGLITAVCSGRATISVRASRNCYEDAVRSFSVDVLPGTIGLSASPESLTIAVNGMQKQLTVTINPSDAAVQYSSSDQSVVTVDADGKLTGVGVGSATITVTASKICYNNAERTVTVTVNCVKGDVNRDSKVNVLDVVRAIDISLERSPEPTSWELCAADVNEDGGITVEDVLGIINRALL